MSTRKRSLLAFALVAMVMGCALLTGWRATRIPTASAQESPVRERQRIATFFGMQTLAPRQTAELTVVNPLEIIPCVRVRIAFDIYESDPPNPVRPGDSDPPAPTHLRFVRSVSRVIELEPGQAASFDYTAGGRGAFVSPATLVHEINDVSDPHTPALDGDTTRQATIRTRTSAATSTLVINERGSVVFTAPGVRVGFDPQPDPPSAP